MSNFASTVKIENFKSIKSLELNNCKRINLFIGRPNVGKSNILEALSLFSLVYWEQNNLKNLIRIEQKSDLFHDGNLLEEISIKIDSDTANIVGDNIGIYNSKENYLCEYDFGLDLIFEEKDKNSRQRNYPYKSYFFPKYFNFSKYPSSFLFPPHGNNLFDVIQSNQSLKQEFLELFKGYGLNLVFDKSSQELKVMKGVEKGEIFLVPFNSIADSLQRLIFFKAAIASNKDSIITFEEPEAHTYPPYIAQIAQDIIQSKTNQFFITTHSPYVVNEFLENAQGELCIYLVDFKDGQTVVKSLSDKELDEVYNNGIDLFFNNELFYE